MFDDNLKLKQYDSSKPVRHKSDLLYETLSGYTYNKEIYCGKVQGNSNNSTEQIVYKLFGDFAKKGHRLFMDNLFNSYGLARIRNSYDWFIQ